MQPVSSTGVGSRGAADSIGEDRLLELSSRDVQWPQSWVSISSWGISAFKGPGHRLTSRRASFLKSVFAGGQVLWGASLLVPSDGVHAQLPCAFTSRSALYEFNHRWL